MGVNLISILVFVCLVTYIIQEFGEVLLFSCPETLGAQGIGIMKFIQLSSINKKKPSNGVD
jgi:hypothetical protein